MVNARVSERKNNNKTPLSLHYLCGSILIDLANDRPAKPYLYRAEPKMFIMSSYITEHVRR